MHQVVAQALTTFEKLADPPRRRRVTPRVSLLIPNRNNEPALDLVFERLAENTRYPDLEVVVVDDGSDDRSLEILRRWRDSGRFARFVLHEQPPSGVVVALNKGLELATGEFVVQLDADATVETPGWLERMLAPASSDERVGVVSPRVVFDSRLRPRATASTSSAPRGCTTAARASPSRSASARCTRTSSACREARRRPRRRAGRGRQRDRLLHDVPAGRRARGRRLRHGLPARLVRRPRPRALHPPQARPSGTSSCPTVHVIHRIGMRHTREDAPPRARARPGRRRAAAARRAVKERIAERTGLGGGPSPEHLERLHHHYAYWREKWGWDLLNPDMDEVRRRYAGLVRCCGGTAVDERRRVCAVVVHLQPHRAAARVPDGGAPGRRARPTTCSSSTTPRRTGRARWCATEFPAGRAARAAGQRGQLRRLPRGDEGGRRARLRLAVGDGRRHDPEPRRARAAARGARAAERPARAGAAGVEGRCGPTASCTR